MGELTVSNGFKHASAIVLISIATVYIAGIFIKVLVTSKNHSLRGNHLESAVAGSYTQVGSNSLQKGRGPDEGRDRRLLVVSSQPVVLPVQTQCLYRVKTCTLDCNKVLTQKICVR